MLTSVLNRIIINIEWIWRGELTTVKTKTEKVEEVEGNMAHYFVNALLILKVKLRRIFKCCTL